MDKALRIIYYEIEAGDSLEFSNPRALLGSRLRVRRERRKRGERFKNDLRRGQIFEFALTPLT